MEKRAVPLSFVGGIDSKTDPFQLPPTKLANLSDAVFGKRGTINTRWGYQALSTSVVGSATGVTSAVALHAFNQELLLFDGSNAYSYSQTRSGWLSRGKLIPVIQKNLSIVHNTYQQTSPDVAYLNGVELYAWEDSRGGIRYSLIDTASGLSLLADQPLFSNMPTTPGATIIRPKCLTFGNLMYVLYGMQTGQIGFVSINPNNPTATNAAGNVLISGVDVQTGYNAGFFDACVSGSQVIVAYVAAGTPAENLFLNAFSGANLSSVWQTQVHTYAAQQDPICVGIAGDISGNAWWVTGITLGNGIRAGMLSSSGSITVADQLIGQFSGVFCQAATLLVTGTTGNYFFETIGASPDLRVIYSQQVSSAGAITSPIPTLPVVARSVGLVSKPFLQGASIYINVSYASASNSQGTYFTIDSSGNVIAKCQAAVAGTPGTAQDTMLSEVPLISSGIFKYANLVRGAVAVIGSSILSLFGVNSTTLDFFNTNHSLSAALQGGFYTVGGVVRSYDGTRYVEHGFHLYPEGVSVVLAPGSPAGGQSAGLYFYMVTYEWVDANGLTQISAPSVALSINLAGGVATQLTISTLRLTSKPNVQIVIYRTAANGTILNRVTSVTAPLYNDPTVDRLTYVDAASDAAIASNAPLYTQPLATTGGNPVLSNASPPASSLICAYANRIILAGLDNPYQYWVSKKPVANAPIEFSSSLAFTLDADGGSISAIFRLDDKLIIFKKFAMFYLQFQGPSNTGDNSDILAPIDIPSGGIGCGNANAIVLTPLGLMFASANGIFLLDRGLNVSYIGAPVEAFNSLTITSATLLPNQWVVFTTSQGTALVYDYLFDQWSTFTNHAAVDSTLYLGSGNLYAWANAAGQVFLQTPGIFSDAGTPINIDLTTSWINPAVIQGYQRIYHAFLLGTYKSTHNLNVYAGFNHNPAFTASAQVVSDTALAIKQFGSGALFGSDALFGGSDGNTDPDQSVYQFRFDILRKCDSFRLRIVGQQTGSGAEGFSLSALTLILGIKAGGNKLPVLKQFGVS